MDISAPSNIEYTCKDNDSSGSYVRTPCTKCGAVHNSLVPDVTLRSHYPSELLSEMWAWKGVCKYCDGVVKMLRETKSCKLAPDSCVCFRCLQSYHMEIEDIETFEKEQWEQEGDE
jgi:hypothetical protein